MKDIEQLAHTYTTDIQDIIPELWSKKVEEAARANRQARNYVRVNQDLKNGGDIIHLPKRQTISAGQINESGTITASDLTYTTLDLEPEPKGAGVQISKKAVEESQIDILKDATTELGEALSNLEDQEILNSLGSASNVIYSGSSTSTATLGSGDVMTPELFQKALKKVRLNNFDPDVAFITPEVHYSLATCDQFMDAAKYGGNDVVQGGRISNFAGVEVITTTNVPTATGSENVTIASCIFAEGNRAGAMAVARDPTVESDYKPLGRRHQIAATMKYAVGLLNDSAVCVAVASHADGTGVS